MCRLVAILQPLAGLLLMFSIGSASADDRIRGEAGLVVDITNSGGLIVELEDGDRLNVRLAGIRQPDEGSAGYEQAHARLETLARDQFVALSYQDEIQRDRYERAIAYVALENGSDLAAQLVREGWAIVYSDLNARLEIENTRMLENEARNASMGLWADQDFAIQSADPNILALHLESVQIVEGRIIDTADTRERIYLNFGFDYRSDFTVSIERRAVPRFEAAGIDLANLQDMRVRVRGWLHRRNGPMISIDHPERLEILGP